jgi:hypothetical protein
MHFTFTKEPKGQAEMRKKHQTKFTLDARNLDQLERKLINSNYN